MTTSEEHPLVSVVVAVYNRSLFIKECLDSLRNQSYSNMEIIIVDDCSTDDSANIIRDWIALHPNIQVLFIRLPRNTGFSGALTTGLFLSKGRYIAIQDSDDVSHPERISKQVHYLLQHPELDLIGTNYIVINEESTPTGEWVGWLQFGPDNINQMYNSGNHCISHGTVLYKAELFDRAGGLNRRMNGAEDYEFISRCHLLGARMDNLPEPLYCYRSHSRQRSRSFYRS
jgi:glycosyltransferase involved in cell wall biosynthesis